jgi:hypothetical protein
VNLADVELPNHLLSLDLLACHAVLVPFVSRHLDGAGPIRLLVVENLAAYFSIWTVLKEQSRCSRPDVHIGWGQGNPFARSVLSIATLEPVPERASSTSATWIWQDCGSPRAPRPVQWPQGCRSCRQRPSATASCWTARRAGGDPIRRIASSIRLRRGVLLASRVATWIRPRAAPGQATYPRKND